MSAARYMPFAFHPIEGLDQREEVQANTRVFVGDGTPYLPVPGLKTLLGVKHSGLEIPLTETREWPTDHTLRRLETAELPVVTVQHNAEGMPVLLRSLCSNDGIWQDGEKVFVIGEWDEAVPAPALPEPDRKSRKGIK